MPETCAVCRREKDPVMGCSDFCATQPAEVQAKFLTMEPGYYGLWPCTECGCVVEDEYPGRGGDSFCSRCWPKVRLRRRDGLLREALPHLPAELATRVRLVLDRS
jgi:hypothetical protein